ncbi:hypothetical protein SKAU_G00041870 [Synaphobranchus kaupii]|uniref:Uncharacterized protein n=1 Tax=Synaphobranchus kaupii TaxID=118154 RepID=A0A9Q1J8X3_SYNKA|nr:hypothetical protein SKAU_G00041870 [Synaphobranchus kaupii]
MHAWYNVNRPCRKHEVTAFLRSSLTDLSPLINGRASLRPSPAFFLKSGPVVDQYRPLDPHHRHLTSQEHLGEQEREAMTYSPCGAAVSTSLAPIFRRPACCRLNSSRKSFPGPARLLEDSCSSHVRFDGTGRWMMKTLVCLVLGLFVLKVVEAGLFRNVRQVELDTYDSANYDVDLENLNLETQDIYDYDAGLIINEPQKCLGNFRLSDGMQGERHFLSGSSFRGNRDESEICLRVTLLHMCVEFVRRR